MSCYVVSCCIMSYHFGSCCVMLCHVVSCRVMLCHVVVIFWHFLCCFVFCCRVICLWSVLYYWFAIFCVFYILVLSFCFLSFWFLSCAREMPELFQQNTWVCIRSTAGCGQNWRKTCACPSVFGSLKFYFSENFRWKICIKLKIRDFLFLSIEFEMTYRLEGPWIL